MRTAKVENVTICTTEFEIASTDVAGDVHSVLKPRGGTPGSAGTGCVGVDFHAITEARDLAYAVYQASHFGEDLPTDDNFEVLRARWSDGE